MKCTYCSKHCYNVNQFILHIEYAHNTQRNYECPFEGCCRSFYRRDIFKKHISLKHVIDEPCSSNNLTNSEYCNNATTISFLNPAVATSEQESTNNNIGPDLDKKIIDFEVLVAKSVLELISNLYTDSTVSREYIQKIVGHIKSFLHSGIFSLLKEILISLTDATSQLDKAKKIENVCDKITESLNNVDTDYKRMKYFKNSNTFIDPIPIIIGTSQDTSKKDNQTSLILKQRTAIYIPVDKTLKLFLELPNVLEKILNHHNVTSTQKSFIKHSDSDNVIFKNFLDGSLWKNDLSKNKGKLVLPLIIYFDDFEVCNPLGSHAGIYKLGAVYFTILSLPPEYISRLENIFLALIFHSVERQEFGNRMVFNELLDSLNKLEQCGIDVSTDKGCFKIFFSAMIITGDNLGVHTIFGLGQSFSSGNCCRFCISTKASQEKQTEINNSEMRNPDNYFDHLAQNQYNVKEYCVWNDLRSFHIYENQCVDLMHDLYEGVFRYDMGSILKFLISEKLFSLETLNSRVKYFEYDVFEKNKPPQVKRDHIQNEIIVFSSSEMLCFVKNFRYFVGDLVPQENVVWKFYLSLLKISNILTMTEISLTEIHEVEQLIKNHLRMYLSIFNGRLLKPKHHLLLHYANTIKKVGPVSKTHCLRFEAKHKILKKFAQNTESRKNIPLTLAKKLQIEFSCRCLAQNGLNDIIDFGKEISSMNYSLYNFIHEFDNNFCATCCLEVKWYEKNGIRYHQRQVICCDRENTPRFALIKHILLEKQNFKRFYLICELMNTVGINLHYQAYILDFDNTYIFLDPNKIFYGFPVLVRKYQNLNLVPC